MSQIQSCIVLYNSNYPSPTNQSRREWSYLWVGWDLYHHTTKHWFIFSNFTPNSSIWVYWSHTDLEHITYIQQSGTNPPPPHTALPCFFPLFFNLNKGNALSSCSEHSDVGTAMVSDREERWPWTVMTNKVSEWPNEWDLFRWHKLNRSFVFAWANVGLRA